MILHTLNSDSELFDEMLHLEMYVCNITQEDYWVVKGKKQVIITTNRPDIKQ